MPVVTKKIKLSSKGETDIIDITGRVADCVKSCGLDDGIAVVFINGSTAGLTTIEYEPGVLADLKQALEVVAPREGEYQHNRKWQDGNGFSHARAALLGPSLSVPFCGKKLHLGAWQQIVFIDFDTRPREREIMVQIIG